MHGVGISSGDPRATLEILNSIYTQTQTQTQKRTRTQTQTQTQTQTDTQTDTQTHRCLYMDGDGIASGDPRAT